MSLRLGSEAPDFDAETTKGNINFHNFIGDSWAVLFSHPADFTPVCTTELGEVARLSDEWTKRNVKVIGLSCNDLKSHGEWIADINEVGHVNLDFPIIADADRSVAKKYDMLDAQDATNVDTKGIPFTVRTVFIIDPKKKIRLTLSYPASTGRQFREIIRVIDSLQLTDKENVTTPVNWQKGDKVIIPPTVSDEDAKKKYGTFETIKYYLRFITLGSS